MATTDTPLGGSWPDDAWPDEEHGSERPIAPELAGCVADAESELAGMMDEAYTSLHEIVSQADRELAMASADANAAVASLIGTIDSALRDVTTPAYKAVDKLSIEVLRALATAEYDLRSVNVAVPYQPEQIALDLSDPSGELILQRLQGIPADPVPVQSDATSYLDTSAEPAVTVQRIELAAPSAPIDAVAPSVGGETDHPCACAPPVVNVTCPAPAAVAPAAVAPALPPPPPADEPVSPGAASGEELANPTVMFSPPPAPAIPSVGGGGGAGGGGGGGPPIDDEPEAPDERPEPIRDYEYAGVRFDRESVCRDILAAKTFLRESPLARDSGADPTSRPDAISSLYRFGLSYTKALGDFVLNGFDRKAAEESFSQNITRTGDILGGLSQARAFLNYLPPETITDKKLSWSLAFAVGTAQKIESDTGMPMTIFTRPLSYLLNTQHATTIPDPAQLDAMRYAGIIGRARWECLQEAHGNDTVLRELYYRTLEPRPSPDVIERMYLREIIDAKARKHYYTLQGMGDSELADQFGKLALFVPTAPDIVTFGVRDVFDENAVAAGGFDTDFDAKFPGFDDPASASPLVKWAKANGLTKETLRLFWRAHWKFPSDTQLFSMLHRLRADRPEYLAFVKDYAAWVDAGKIGPEPEEPPVISAKEVQQAIEINDVAPAFVARLMAVSYLPMNRTDAINAYMANTRDEAWLYERFRDNGYDERTAREMVSIQQTLRARRIANVSGVWTIRKILNAYRAGNLSALRADILLTPLVSDQRQRQDMLSGTDAERDAATRAQQIKAIRRGFFVGESDRDGVELALTRLGVDQRQITALADQWQADRDGRFREVTVRNLITWQQTGIITPPEAFARYRRLGYTEGDANRFTLQGMMSRAEKITGQFEKAEAKREKVIKSLKQAAKEDQAALEKRQKELEKARKDAEDELARVNKELELRKPPTN